MAAPRTQIGHALDELAIVRSFTTIEKERRERMADAARQLAIDGGYRAVTMRAVAERAATTPATVYRYFGSKDGLLQHLMLGWAVNSVEQLHRDSGSRIGTTADRVSAGFQDVIRWAADDRNLLSAVMRPPVPAANMPGQGINRWRALFVELVRACQADPSWTDDQGRALTLGHVLIACLLELTVGREHTDAVCANIDIAAHLLF